MRTPLLLVFLMFPFLLQASEGRNQFLDRFLEVEKPTLPSEYLLIAKQPLGIVSKMVVIDLESGTVTCVPGTHEWKRGWRPESVSTLSDEERKFLRDLLTSKPMTEFPATSGKMGMDGSSDVIYYRVGGTERFISHWLGTHIGLAPFQMLLNRYYSDALNTKWQRVPES